MENQKQQQQMQLRKRILLFPLPLQGHIRPMLNLANALYSKGFSISIIHTFYNSPDSTKYPNFTFHFIDDGLSSRPDADSLEVFSAIRETCAEPFRNCIFQILTDGCGSEDKDPIACLIADLGWAFPGSVADSFNLPRIVLRCGSVLASAVYDSLSLLRDHGYFPVQESRLEEPVLELPPLKVKDLPPETHHGILTALAETGRSYKLGMICNAFEELEPSVMARMHQDYHPIPIFPIGPLHKYCSNTPSSTINNKDESAISWLNKQAPKSVLYVSFGSLTTITEAEFSEVAWGLANSKQPFLWAFRTGFIPSLERENTFPTGFLEAVSERGHIVEWAPQLEVLAHPAVGGFWTHCGWNSTLESICEGVPMICRPFFFDQIMNARHVSDVWRVGLLMEKELHKDEIETAIRRVMVEKEGEEMRERAGVLKEKANLCLMENGSSYNALDRLTSHILSLQYISGASN